MSPSNTFYNAEKTVIFCEYNTSAISMRNLPIEFNASVYDRSIFSA